MSFASVFESDWQGYLICPGEFQLPIRVHGTGHKKRDLRTEFDVDADDRHTEVRAFAIRARPSCRS